LEIITFISSGNGTHVFSENSFTVIILLIVISAFFFKFVETVACLFGFVLAGVAVALTRFLTGLALPLEVLILLLIPGLLQCGALDGALPGVLLGGGLLVGEGFAVGA
jgi:hypothetical protein